ncbi:MAG: winged helix-turn-helix transcriptional regulator [Clostridia bacterium]|nr:winged helix-turn-helix transcriptional regulator [Clostridia bacterium]
MKKEQNGSAGRVRRNHPDEIMFMVNQLSRIFHCEMRKVCEENGVPVGYRSLLFHLVHNNGCSQRILAEKTGLKPSTISITLDKMERDGYITRQRNDMDQRAVRVFLTEKGMNIDVANRARIAELDARFSSTVSAEEKRQLIDLLEKVMSGYCAQQEMETPCCQRPGVDEE